MTALAPTPPGARVDVWLVEAGRGGDHGAPAHASCRLLDDGERSAIARLRAARDRRDYLAAHLLLRLALSRAAAGRVPPAQWRFDRSPGGRPSLAPGFGVRPDFSLSRSSGLAAVAVAAEGCRVGVDAERADRPVGHIPADVALSGAERSHLARRRPHRQPEEFLTRWTLKEAYGKLRGCGVCLPLERLEVAVSRAGRARIVRTEAGLRPPEGLHLESRLVRTAAGVYRASLAVLCPPGVRPRVTFHLCETLWQEGEEEACHARDGVAGKRDAGGEAA